MEARSYPMEELLPEILLHIFSYLTPEQLCQVALVNKQFNDLLKDDVFWKQKFIQHFTDASHYKGLTTFKNTYAREHNGTSINIKRIISFIKEGDIQSLANWHLPSFILDLPEKNKKIVDLILEKNNQRILDYFYKLIMSDHSYNKKQRTLAAFMFNQPMTTIKALLDKNLDINHRYNEQLTLLHYTVAAGHLHIATHLIKIGAMVDALSIKEETPLHFAVKYDRMDMVTLLLEHNANPNLCNKNGKSSLYMAISNGHTDIAYHLIKHGASTILHNQPNTALHLAVLHCQKEIVRWLLDNKIVDVNTLSDEFTPLAIAAEQGFISIAKLLIQYGAKYSVAMPLTKHDTIYISISNQQKSPLYLAAENDHLQIVDFLLGLFKPPSHDFAHALQIAVNKNLLSMATLLLNKQAEFYPHIESLDPALLRIAATLGHLTIVNILLTKKIDIHTSSLSMTAISLAIDNNHMRIAFILLKASLLETCYLYKNNINLTSAIEFTEDWIQFVSSKLTSPTTIKSLLLPDHQFCLLLAGIMALKKHISDDTIDIPAWQDIATYYYNNLDSEDSDYCAIREIAQQLHDNILAPASHRIAAFNRIANEYFIFYSKLYPDNLNTFSTLPEQSQLHILSLLPLSQSCQMASTSKKYLGLFNSASFRETHLRSFGFTQLEASNLYNYGSTVFIDGTMFWKTAILTLKYIEKNIKPFLNETVDKLLACQSSNISSLFNPETLSTHYMPHSPHLVSLWARFDNDLINARKGENSTYFYIQQENNQDICKLNREGKKIIDMLHSYTFKHIQFFYIYACAFMSDSPDTDYRWWSTITSENWDVTTKKLFTVLYNQQNYYEEMILYNYEKRMRL